MLRKIAREALRGYKQACDAFGKALRYKATGYTQFTSGRFNNFIDTSKFLAAKQIVFFQTTVSLLTAEEA